MQNLGSNKKCITKVFTTEQGGKIMESILLGTGEILKQKGNKHLGEYTIVKKGDVTVKFKELG